MLKRELAHYKSEFAQERDAFHKEADEARRVQQTHLHARTEALRIEADDRVHEAQRSAQARLDEARAIHQAQMGAMTTHYEGLMRSMVPTPPTGGAAAKEPPESGRLKPSDTAYVPPPRADEVEARLIEWLQANMAKVVEVFLSWDRDRDGRVSKAEFNSAMKKLGVAATTEEIRALFAKFDPDGSGSIDYRELKKRLAAGRTPSVTRGS